MNKLPKILIAIITLSLLSLNCWAELRLNVTPYEGTGYEYGRLDPIRPSSKEGRIRMTSTGASGYEIRQRLDSLIDVNTRQLLNVDVISSYTLRGSNAYGTLYQDIPASLGRVEQTLYSSSSAGLSDSFVTVYSIDPSKIQARGDFAGKIIYRMVPQTSADTEPSPIIVDIRFSLRGFGVETKTSSGSKDALDLYSDDREIKGYFDLDISGTGDRYTIIQSVDPAKLNQSFKNERDQVMPADLITFYVTGRQGEALVASYTALEKEPIPVYLQNAGIDDKVRVNFKIDKDKIGSLTADTIYRVHLLYTLEGTTATMRTVPLELKLHVKRDFSMEISFDSPQGLAFMGLKPNDPAVEREVKFKINSNLKKRYQIIQDIPDGFAPVNGGQTVPQKYFLIKQEMPKGKQGTLPYEELTPVAKGKDTIFLSDDNGTPSEFKVIYSLQIPRDYQSGDYSARVTYMLLEK